MNALQLLLLFSLVVVAIFLILVVLVQRGRGGGLTGALGGMGGQSAFGTKAGDTFTKITIWTAVVWILLCVVAVKYLGTKNRDALGDTNATTAESSTQISLPPDAKNSQAGSDTGAKPNSSPSGATPATPATRPPASATPPPAPVAPADGK